MNITTINLGKIGPITSIGDGVYTAEAIAPRGEKMYIAIEPMGDGEKWELYRTTAGFLANGGDCSYAIGSLAGLGSCVNDEIELKNFSEKYKDSTFWTSNELQFKELSNKLTERNITIGSSKEKELSTILHASRGMNVKSQTHMVYVSKKPISGLAIFDTPLEDDKPYNFGDYVKQYGHIVMSVGVKITDIVENRGIFRNPWSIVEGGYSGISMMLHAFTCKVIQEYWSYVTSFKVRPLKQMGEIFMKSLPKDQVTVNGIRGDKYQGGFESEQNVIVPVDVLAKLCPNNI